MKWLDLITDILIEAEWLAQGEVPEPQDAQFVLNKINDELDQWSAEDKYIYTKNFQLFNLIPNHQPHTIGPGPGADFVLPARPPRIDGCTIVLQNAGGTTTDLPVNTERDDDWWNSVRIKNLASQIPTDLYYSTDVPNGQMFFWPIPNFAYQTRIEWWVSVLQVASVQDPAVLPPAYRKAVKLTIAEQLAGPRSGDPQLVKAALQARSAVWSNNNNAPTMSTQAAGMPGSNNHTRFNFLDGTPW